MLCKSYLSSKSMSGMSSNPGVTMRDLPRRYVFWNSLKQQLPSTVAKMTTSVVEMTITVVKVTITVAKMT